MYKLVAVAIVTILAFNVAASEGGLNEGTDLSETNILAIDANDVAYAESEFTISVTLKDDAIENLSLIHI